MGRKTIRLCQDHWQEKNPDDYPPNVVTYGNCEECGDYGLTFREYIVDETPE